MSELAIVSARTAKLQALAKKGSRGAQTAIELASDPGRFLSTVQIGITLVGIVAGAYSGSSLGGPVGERLVPLGVPEDIAGDTGFVLVILVTTYLSLVIGELVPKQLALQAAVPIATTMSRPMRMLARVAAPVVWLLDKSSGLLVRLFGIRKGGQGSFNAEELQMIFAEATRSGVIEQEQGDILTGTLRLANRPVREIMTPRTEIDWLPVDAGRDDILRAVEETPHSLLPVAEGSVESVVGVVKLREVLAELLEGRAPDLAAIMVKPAIVPDQLDALDALRTLQSSDVAMAMVHDEYGHLDGILTPADLLSAIAGDFASHRDEGDTPQVVERADGSLLIAGSLGADSFAERLALELPEEREFATAAGFVLEMLKRLPDEGEAFEAQGWRFEVVDLDGRRIDKLLVSPLDRPPLAADDA